MSLAGEADQASRQMFQFAQRTKQKIAAFGSSYREMHSNVGAAAGCDLFTDADYAPGTKCFCAVPRAIRREM